MGDWQPTKEEQRLHDLLDQLNDFAKELGINTDLVDALFNVFYNAVDEQGKMSDITITDEERYRIMGDVWEKMVQRGMIDFSKIPEA